MDPSNISFLSNASILHLHDCGRKCKFQNQKDITSLKSLTANQSKNWLVNGFAWCFVDHRKFSYNQEVDSITKKVYNLTLGQNDMSQNLSPSPRTNWKETSFRASREELNVMWIFVGWLVGGEFVAHPKNSWNRTMILDVEEKCLHFICFTY